MFHPGTELEPA